MPWIPKELSLVTRIIPALKSPTLTPFSLPLFMPKAALWGVPISAIVDGRLMDLFLVRATPAADAARQPDVTCPLCAKQGSVYLTPFRWGGERQLNWYCGACGHVWIIPERRRNGRS